jgi:hypothetical protein
MDIEKIIEASQQKGIRFNLANGTYVSIQQNENVYCSLRHGERLGSCEVGIFYNDDDDTAVVIGWV